jgi:hypothetical protein
VNFIVFRGFGIQILLFLIMEFMPCKMFRKIMMIIADKMKGG